MINVCKELKCPFAYKNGCDRFSLALFCPLAKVEGATASQYFVHGEDSIDLAAAKFALESEVLNDEQSKHRLWAEKTLRTEAPVMIWEG